MSRRYVRAPVVSEMTGVETNTLKQWRRTNVGPEWVRLGPRLIAYPLDGVEQWLRDREQATKEQSA